MTVLPEVSIWLTSDGGTHHYGCGQRASAEELAARYQTAKVATVELGPCCEAEDIACAFDVFCDAEDHDPAVVLSYALARAEGRDIDPPYRCAVHRCLTFGGCCAPIEPTNKEK